MMNKLLLLVAALPMMVSAQNYVSVSTFAGTDSDGLVNGTLTASRFNMPYGICYDSQTATHYVADAYNHCIRKIQSGVVSTVAGTGNSGDSDGPALSAEFDTPTGVFYKNGILYICDNLNNKIKQLDQFGNVTTIAGWGQSGSQDGPALSATFYQPKSIAVDNNGVIYVADYESHKIRKIENGIVSTVAGNGIAGDGFGPALSISLHRPRDLCIAQDGTVYFVDLMNHKVKRLNTNGIVEVVAGSGTPGGADGTGVGAQFNTPVGIDWLNSTTLVVLDAVNPRVRRLTTSGVVTTLAGAGADGYLDGAPLTARFDLPQDICVGPGGDVYISDRNNHCIRLLDSDVTGDGIDEEQNVVSLVSFPNPGHDGIVIDLGAVQEDLENLTVVDQAGRMVMNSTPLGVRSGTSMVLPIEQLTAGEYHVILRTRAAIYRTSFVKQ